MSNTAKDVSKAIDKFMAGEISWDEVIKIGTGVSYRKSLKDDSWGDGGIPNMGDDMTFGDAVLMAFSPKVKLPMLQELLAVGKVID